MEMEIVYTPREIAETLYGATEDMDFMDYTEEKEDNLNRLESEIERIKNWDFEGLYRILEYLTDRWYE